MKMRLRKKKEEEQEVSSENLQELTDKDLSGKIEIVSDNQYLHFKLDEILREQKNLRELFLSITE